MAGKPIAYNHIGVVGGGAWGTALAFAAAVAGRSVTLWARESGVVDSINRERQNAFFLPGVMLPKSIVATGEIEAAMQADAVLMVVPAQHLRGALMTLPQISGKPLVLCAKGIERGTGKLLTEVLGETAPQAVPAILSGPSFAKDVGIGLPTAVTIAAQMDVATRLQAALSSATFRPYASDDLVGVALGGAAKNVYAIGCGIVSGMRLGDSARAAFLARGFAELCRLGEAIGARAETLMGLSGLGDLVLTATSATSRNYAFGLSLGGGAARSEIFAPGRPLAEGVETAPALVARGRAQRVELPIGETIAALLDGSLALDQAVPRLMGRPLKPE
jgi:glycerol-3-phosphate dehydrogenase (NAD(P)+)